ncbi:hypothetical protein AVEN_23451-1 [Araneus ventricosus]|uniref:Uncharacterized protein n=1 Tax=Araneus ventricosus TaxID=182803 RepID=A0A4Y2E9E0_ARAVE|nr:hypothetical protein AVEN_23451-1 [Araneus ventricosus]
MQISNANRLQLTSNKSNSTLGFCNTNSQQVSNIDSKSTFNRAQLIGFPARTADETRKSFFKGTFNILHISTPNRDIKKIIAFSGIFDLSPNSPKWSPRSGVRDRGRNTF